MKYHWNSMKINEDFRRIEEISRIIKFYGAISLYEFIYYVEYVTDFKKLSTFAAPLPGWRNW